MKTARPSTNEINPSFIDNNMASISTKNNINDGGESRK